MATEIVCTKTLKPLKIVKTGLFAIGDELVAGEKYATDEPGGCEVIVVTKKIEVEVLIADESTKLAA